MLKRATAPTEADILAELALPVEYFLAWSRRGSTVDRVCRVVGPAGRELFRVTLPTATREAGERRQCVCCGLKIAVNGKLLHVGEFPVHEVCVDRERRVPTEQALAAGEG